MPCPHCHGDSQVTNTRARDGYIYRRRRCLACRALFSTREIYIDDVPVDHRLPADVADALRVIARYVAARDEGGEL
jgi:hypothetical protein